MNRLATRRNEACFVGILCGVLLSALLLLGASAFDSSQPPPPTPAARVANDKGLSPGESGDRDGDNGKPAPLATRLNQLDSESAQRPHGDRHDNHDDDPPTSGWAKADVILAAVFSCLLVVVGFLQWHLMRRGLKVAELSAQAAKETADVAEQTAQHMRLEQRAWIGPTNIKLSVPTAGEKTRCKIKIKNTGKTPGTIVKVDEIVRNGRDEIDEFAAVDIAVQSLGDLPFSTQIVLPPGATMWFPLASPDTLTEFDIAALDDERLAITVIFYIEYTDVTGAIRITQGAYRYDHTRKCLVSHQENNKME